MKRIIKITIIFVLVCSIIGCNETINNQEHRKAIEEFNHNNINDDSNTSEEQVNQRDDIVLERINNLMKTEYKTTDEAFEEETKKYEINNSADSLFCIYIIICNDSEYYKYITNYYKQVIVLYSDDEKFAEKYSQIPITETSIDYLKNLLKEEKYEEYQEFYIDITKYIKEPDNWFYVLSWFKRDGIELTPYEANLHLQALYEYEEKYAENIPLRISFLLYTTISELADGLEKEDVRLQYQEKKDEVHQIITGMSSEFATGWTIDIEKINYEEKLSQLDSMISYEKKYSEYMSNEDKIYLYNRIAVISYELGNEEMGSIYEKMYSELSDNGQS